jgi:hypothetical protein
MERAAQELGTKACLMSELLNLGSGRVEAIPQRVFGRTLVGSRALLFEILGCNLIGLKTKSWSVQSSLANFTNVTFGMFKAQETHSESVHEY